MNPEIMIFIQRKMKNKQQFHPWILLSTICHLPELQEAYVDVDALDCLSHRLL